MRKRVSYVGQKFGRLKVLRDGPIVLDGVKHWHKSTSICLCDCGKELTVRNGSLKSGTTQSCGCWNVEALITRATTHGKSKTKTYKVWKSMIRRCTNPNERGYENYGGRGIKVCERWLIFENFYEDMGECPPGLTIERINNDGNYEPSNCKWDTRKVQARNTRRNLIYTIDGVTACLKDLCAIYNKNYSAIIQRLTTLGWSFERAWSEPIRP